MQTSVVNSVDQLTSILDNTRTIAVVGCSDRPERTSFAIYRYLKTAGYEVIPVNPHHETCDGDKAYPDLLSVPESMQIDVVNVFRNPRYTADMVEAAAQRAESTGHRPVVWTQIGVSSPDAEATAREHDLPYVKNRCIMVEHSRLF
ncbi:MAG: CoA-binding protein [Rhodothermales bacterium]